MQSPITGKRTGQIIIRSASRISRDKYGLEDVDEYFQDRGNVFVLSSGKRISATVSGDRVSITPASNAAREEDNVNANSSNNNEERLTASSIKRKNKVFISRELNEDQTLIAAAESMKNKLASTARLVEETDALAPVSDSQIDYSLSTTTNGTLSPSAPSGNETMSIPNGNKDGINTPSSLRTRDPSSRINKTLNFDNEITPSQSLGNGDGYYGDNGYYDENDDNGDDQDRNLGPMSGVVSNKRRKATELLAKPRKEQNNNNSGSGLASRLFQDDHDESFDPENKSLKRAQQQKQYNKRQQEENENENEEDDDKEVIWRDPAYADPPNVDIPGVRRSKRKRWHPLKSWEGERLVEHLHKSKNSKSKNTEGVAVIDIVVEPVPPTSLFLLAKQKPRKKSTRPKKTSKSLQPDPRIPSSFQDLPDSQTISYKDINTGAIVSTPIVRWASTADENLQSLPGDSIDGELTNEIGESSSSTAPKVKAGAVFDPSDFLCGNVFIAPQSTKTLESVERYSQVFTIIRAQERSIGVTIEDNTFILSAEDHFFVPPGCAYSISNFSNVQEAKINFVIIKRDEISTSPEQSLDQQSPSKLSLLSDTNRFNQSTLQPIQEDSLLSS